MIKYLDEPIIIRVPSTGSFYAPYSGTYQYKVRYAGSDIFFGNLFMNQGETYVDVDVTDIMKNYKHNKTPDYYAHQTNTYADIDGVSGTISVYVSVNSSDYIGSCDINFIYHYPRRIKGMEYEILCPVDTDYVHPMLQGVYLDTSNNYQLKFKPHFPFTSTSQYYFPTMFNCGDNVFSGYTTPLTFSGNIFGSAKTIYVSNDEITVDVRTLSNLFSGVTRGTTNDPGYVNIKGSQYAVIDVCPSKYYLMWTDRFCGWQSRGFDGRSVYTEGFKTEYSKSIYGERKLIDVDVTPSFEINTDWINEDEVPYYESIYVSNFLKLYDVENDVAYDVIITDTSYEEKKFKNNNKKMVNITLNLNISKQQTIIY